MKNCNCKKCTDRENVIMSICDLKNLDYKTITEKHKTDLYFNFIHNSQHSEHNWKIMKHKFAYADKQNIKFLLALRDFVDCADSLSESWSNYFDDQYPFDYDFQEIVSDISNWYFESLEKINVLKEG